MKPVDWTYELYVRGTSTKTLPMEDFAEIAKKLAEVLGSKEHVRFKALRDGSARFLAKVQDPGLQAVEVQLLRAKNEEGPGAGKIAKLNEFLGSRGWRADLKNRQGAVIISFPGTAEKAELQPVLTVQQVDTLIGQVIKIGGRDETVPMTIQTPEGVFVEVTVKGKEQAKELGHHLYGDDLKFTGNATWTRNEDGHWSCSDMVVTSFEKPDTTSLTELFTLLQQLPDNHWHTIEDPIAEWKKDRGDH